MAEFRGEGDAKNIPPEFEETISRLTQESLTNAVRHANAKNFRTVLDVSGNKFQLQLVDDGAASIRGRNMKVTGSSEWRNGSTA
jgi:signal transduction histidine kinase